MSPYKKFIASVKEYFESVPVLKFLLSAYIFVFAAGGAFFLLGQFIFGISNSFTTIGTLLMLSGLILTLVKEDVMALLITSGVIALGSLIAWIIRIIQLASFGFYSGFASYYLGDFFFQFSSLFYFLAFGAIAVLVLIKSEKFKEMRAAAAAKAAVPARTVPTVRRSRPARRGFMRAIAAREPPGPRSTPPPLRPVCASVLSAVRAPGPAQYEPPAPRSTAPAAPAERLRLRSAPPGRDGSVSLRGGARQWLQSCGQRLPPGARFLRPNAAQNNNGSSHTKGLSRKWRPLVLSSCGAR
jgi:hypothetical protein